MKKTLLILGCLVMAMSCSQKQEKEVRYLASVEPTLIIYDLTEENVPLASSTMVRGTEVVVSPGESIEYEEQKFLPAQIGELKFYVLENNTVANREDCAQEVSIWVRTPASVIDDTTCAHICGLAEKGKKYNVVGYDKLLNDGTIRRYDIVCGHDTGWIYGKYTVFNEEEAKARYMPEKYDPIHSKVRNTFGGGDAMGCDYYPVEKPEFANNKMPDPVYSLYLNFSPAVIGNIDEFIEFAKQTKINTFVLDMKDNQCPAFKAEAMEKYSPTNYKRAGANKEKMYADAVKKLHDEGFYVIGRITCFKDSYFVEDNPSCAITDKTTGKPFYHNKAYWPSAYDRQVWQFNVELAKECVQKFGLNEINFDYVRFPDKMQSVESKIDYHNKYNESKVQAIQRFVQYACDELHELGAYVSIDVFGETTNKGYTTAYGQYWPALSNVADVMSGMPYPDHFAAGYAGIRKPWNNPYMTLNHWGKCAQSRQEECPTPAKVRTWVQAYHVMKYVDPEGIDYNGYNIAQEIRGLYDAGCRDGYVTWLSNSSLQMYKDKRSAFEIDYKEDFLARSNN